MVGVCVNWWFYHHNYLIDNQFSSDKSGVDESREVIANGVKQLSKSLKLLESLDTPLSIFIYFIENQNFKS